MSGQDDYSSTQNQETQQQAEPEQQLARSNTTTKDYYQERDLARLCILFGSREIELDEEKMQVAEFIYSSVHDIIEYFENSLYRNIVEPSRLDRTGFLLRAEVPGWKVGESPYFGNRWTPAHIADCDKTNQKKA